MKGNRGVDGVNVLINPAEKIIKLKDTILSNNIGIGMGVLIIASAFLINNPEYIAENLFMDMSKDLVEGVRFLAGCVGVCGAAVTGNNVYYRWRNKSLLDDAKKSLSEKEKSNTLDNQIKEKGLDLINSIKEGLPELLAKNKFNEEQLSEIMEVLAANKIPTSENLKEMINSSDPKEVEQALSEIKKSEDELSCSMDENNYNVNKTKNINFIPKIPNSNNNALVINSKSTNLRNVSPEKLDELLGDMPEYIQNKVKDKNLSEGKDNAEVENLSNDINDEGIEL